MCHKINSFFPLSLLKLVGLRHSGAKEVVVEVVGEDVGAKSEEKVETPVKIAAAAATTATTTTTENRFNLDIGTVVCGCDAATVSFTDLNP